MKETKEALIALVTLGKFVSERLKDGVQIDDAFALGSALLSDEKFKTVINAGLKDISLVDDEFADFNFAKAMSLVQVMPELVKIIRA